MRQYSRWLSVALLVGAFYQPLAGQQVDWHTRVDFFADNTEFFTPYRVGETLLGARFSSWLEASLGPRTSFWAGVEGERRWGAENFVDSLKPLISFRYRTPHTEVHLGAHDGSNRHGLLDAIVVSTCQFTAGEEFGGQWRETRGIVKSDLWLNWQQLNTPTQREGFEMGAVISVTPSAGLTLEGQHLWSHRGGQLYDAGVPVSNNRVSALGLSYQQPLPVVGEARASVHQLWSVGHLEPPPGDTRPEKGKGTLARLSVVPTGWPELFALSWWGRDFSAAAGDANYGSTGHDGVFYRAKRRYTELGVLHTADIEAGITLTLEARLHRIDNEKSIAFTNSPWEYSYRAVVNVPIDVAIRRR